FSSWRQASSRSVVTRVKWRSHDAIRSNPARPLTLMPYVAHGQASPPALGGAFAVGYVETRAAAVDAGRAALLAYRDATRQQTGCIAVELFAQTGRPGHFAVVETWRNQAALDARDASAKKQLMDALAPIRISDYDERPYKPLTLAADK